MSALPVESSDLLRRLVRNEASVAEIRSALLPETAAAFDEQWPLLLSDAARTLDLSPVHAFVESSRLTAILGLHLGPDGYRALMARAEEKIAQSEEAGPPSGQDWDWRSSRPTRRPRSGTSSSAPQG